MYAEWSDFNGAERYFDEPAADGSDEWRDLAAVIDALPTCMQVSRQAGKAGRPIFDPKATNQALNEGTQARGWRLIPVPGTLREFGNDWDGGRHATLAEWQFSHYSFLWNNVMRTEAVFKQQVRLAHMDAIGALIIVTKSGIFPSSNSSLYYEQARAQLDAVTRLGVFDVPIRLVGLSVPPEAPELEVTWSAYTDRTSRTVEASEPRNVSIRWTGRDSKYGAPTAVFDFD